MNELTTITQRTRRPEMQRLRVYLAGKISQGVPWRCEALGGLETEAVFASGAKHESGAARMLSFCDTQDALDPGAVMRAHGAGGALDVVGPFFVGCDHECAAGPGLHAVIACNEGVGAPEPAEIHQLGERIHEVNLSRIRRADFVFAHVNEIDCFGTFSEIGFAHGVGTPVHLHFGRAVTRKQRDDMWFVAGFARSVHEGVSVRYAFERALELHGYRRGPRAGSTCGGRAP